MQVENILHTSCLAERALRRSRSLTSFTSSCSILLFACQIKTKIIGNVNSHSCKKTAIWQYNMSWTLIKNYNKINKCNYQAFNASSLFLCRRKREVWLGESGSLRQSPFCTRFLLDQMWSVAFTFNIAIIFQNTISHGYHFPYHKKQYPINNNFTIYGITKTVYPKVRAPK